jgi:hypothetical protein
MASRTRLLRVSSPSLSLEAIQPLCHMAFPLETIETFFGTKFREGWLTHFDGYAHWHLLWVPEMGHYLQIVVGDHPTPNAYPTLEVGGRYTDEVAVMSVSNSDGEITGAALILRPIGADTSMNYVVITKTKGGTLSLSTTVGETSSATWT